VANQNGHIVTEATYPYVSGNGFAPACGLNASMPVGGTIVGHHDLPHNESQMAVWVSYGGPLSIAVDATSWQTYTSGILTNCISNQIDHGVLIVGYDMTNSPPYWIVKNSWGTSWGENGYIRIEYGSDQCLLTSYPCSSNASGVQPTTPPPGPTSPPGPSGQWTQRHCKDFSCQDCESHSRAQNTCIAGDGFWYTAQCVSDGIIFNYYTASGCTGTPARTSVDPVNQCSLLTSFFDTKFVQNDCPSGPPPGPPTTAPVPPPPPTPTPTQGQDFTQMQCQDAACSVGCTNYSFPQNECLSLSGGGSAMAQCQPGALVLTEYQTQDCSGPGTPDSMQLNTCLQGTGVYFENFCPGQTTKYVPGRKPEATRRIQHRKKH